MSRYRFETGFYGFKEGFLLIELLLGISMVALFALAVGNYLARLSYDHQEGINRLKAVSIARTTFEKVCIGKQDTLEQEEPFSIEWEQLPRDEVPFSHVRVTVSWYDKKGVQSVSLDSGVAHAHG